MRKIVQAFHDNNPAQLKNQYLFLAQVLISITLMSTTSSQVAERILTYVMQAQLEYVEFSKNHPFLEQTITNLAILKRTSQSYLESLQLWEWLKQIQEEVYGPDSEVIIYTYKNIGICYLAMGIPEKSEEYYLKALTLMEQMQSEGDSATDPELLKEDREQLASIYNNLYLSSVTNNEKDKAKQYIQKTLHFNSLVHG
jgi:tetratricopeptide (TPR) repeat protein